MAAFINITTADGQLVTLNISHIVSIRKLSTVPYAETEVAVSTGVVYMCRNPQTTILAEIKAAQS